MKKGWLDKYNDNVPKAQVGREELLKIGRGEINRGDISTYYPELNKIKQKPKVEQVVAAAKEKAKQEELKKILSKKQTFVGPRDESVVSDNMRKAMAQEQEMAQAQQNSPLAQTMGMFTPGGYNPGAGAAGAETFAEMNPLITGQVLSASRLSKQVTGGNPYGFGQSTFGNVLGGIGLLGDIAGVSSVLGMKPTASIVESSPVDFFGKQKEIPKWFLEQERFRSLPELNDPGASSVLKNFKQRIKTPEGQKRLKELGITETELLENLKVVADEKTLGQYWLNRIGINPELPEKKRVVRHEIEHAVQDAFNESQMKKATRWYDKYLGTGVNRKLKAVRDVTTDIDKSLGDLELKKTPEKVDWEKIKEERGDLDPAAFFDYLSDKQRATNYFASGSGGREKSAFLGEVQQYMLDQGIIKHPYEKITPEMVKNTFTDALFDNEKGGKYLRLFNIMKPTEKNYKLISENLNKLLGIVPAAIAAKSLEQKKEGGWLNKYQDGGEYLGTTNKGFDYNGAWGGPSMQDGGSTLTAEQLESLNLAKMRSKMALAAAFGNPSAKRMTSVSPSTYKFSGNEMIDGESAGVRPGETGTHFMASMGEYAVPYIQEGPNGKLQFKPNASFRDREAIRFDNPKDARYFAEHYKEVAPMMKKYAMGGSFFGPTGMMYARTQDPAPSDGPYAKKTLPSAQDGSKEITYTHQPSTHYDDRGKYIGPGEMYMLKRTVTPYTKNRDIRRYTPAPTNPREVNFISNYAGSGVIGEPLNLKQNPEYTYPTAVPFEGEKHWNIDRFVLDPAFLFSSYDMPEVTDIGKAKKNVLADMQKYYMLQGQDRNDAFKSAKKFVRKEVNPRLNSEYIKESNDRLSRVSGKSITAFADDNPFISLRTANNRDVEHFKSNPNFAKYLENPLTEKDMKKISFSYLKNFKKLSGKESRQQVKQWIKEADDYDKDYNYQMTHPRERPGPFCPPGYEYNVESQECVPIKKEQLMNGGDMSFYQQGLDWTPRNISRDGSEIPQAQPGKIIPKWQQRLNEEAAKLDNPLSTFQLMKKGYSKSEATQIQNAAAKSVQNQPSIQSSSKPVNIEERNRKNKQYADQYGRDYNERTGAVEAPFSPSTDKMLRRASENIVEPMLDIEMVMSGAPLVRAGLKKAAPFTSELVEHVLRNIDNKFISPIRYKKEIDELKKLHSLSAERFNNPEAAKRLKHVLGINPKDMDYPSLLFNFGEGSHYSSFGNYIDIDIKQAKQLSKDYMLNPKSIYEHEFGHFLQREANRHSEEFANDLMKYREELAKYNDPENLEKLKDINSWFGKSAKDLTFNPGPEPIPKTHPTKIDRYANQVYDVDPVHRMFEIEPRSNYAIESSNYFTHRDVEQMAHLREMRQNMLDKGYIKDYYEPISEETIQKFIKDNPTDRVSSFTDPNNKDRIKGLQKIFRNLPVAVPAVGAATAATTVNKKKKGGDVKKDDNGYWNPENWGKPVEISSPYITMEGVYEPLLGVSDTGDTQLMLPGEDYEFDGESVTEYPIDRLGAWLEKYK